MKAMAIRRWAVGYGLLARSTLLVHAQVDNYKQLLQAKLAGTVIDSAGSIAAGEMPTA